jgi:hypothetical protein
MSLTSKQHADDFSSTSHDIVGKTKSRTKFLCMLCKQSHLNHLFPHMEEASKFLEDMTVSQPQLPVAYQKLSLNPPVVDGMINLSPSSVSPVDQVVNLVMSLVELVDQVVDPIPSSVDLTLPLESDTKAVDPFPPVDPILPLESETQVVDLVLSSVDPTPPLMSAKVTDLVPSSVSPTLHPKSAKVVDSIPSSVNPTLPLKSVCVVDLIPSSVDPTLPLESKPNTTHVFLIDTGSAVSRGIRPSPVKPPPCNEVILFNWDVLTGPRLPSHIPFQITMEVCGRDIPETLIDEGASVSILSSFAWQALGCPQLALVT